MKRTVSVEGPATALISRSEKGFSIVEVMVAFAILAVGMAGVGTMMMMSMKSDHYAKSTKDSTLWAIEQIEQLKCEATDTDVKATYDPDDDGIVQYTDIVRYRYGQAESVKVRGTDKQDYRYSYKWEITEDSPVVGIDRVDITVGWDGDLLVLPMDGKCPDTRGKTTCAENPYCCKRKSTTTNFVVRE